jgi:hypothetical protein
MHTYDTRTRHHWQYTKSPRKQIIRLWSCTISLTQMLDETSLWERKWKTHRKKKSVRRNVVINTNLSYSKSATIKRTCTPVSVHSFFFPFLHHPIYILWLDITANDYLTSASVPVRDPRVSVMRQDSHKWSVHGPMLLWVWSIGRSTARRWLATLGHIYTYQPNL